MENKDISIMVLGDVHAQFRELNGLIKMEKPDLIIQCGDFGFWPKAVDLSTIENNDTVICWCDGNHEDFNSIDKLVALNGKEPVEILSNILYCPRGSHIKLPDGRRVLFVGGADSQDKFLRTEGKNWFPQEIITEQDFQSLPDLDVDIIVSHTTPQYFITHNHRWFEATEKDPSCKILNKVFDKYKPSLWYFGHWHVNRNGVYGNCQWFCLNREKKAGWWRWIEPKNNS
jgi:predicted phosphodiesterase